MRASEQHSSAWARWAGGLSLLYACLNPQPDVEPTYDGDRSDDNVSILVPSGPETCDDNPLLAACPGNAGQPGSAQGGSSNSPPMSAAGAGGQSGSGQMPGDAGPDPTADTASGLPDAGPGDAGGSDAQTL